MISNLYGTVHHMSMCREGALRAPFIIKFFSILYCRYSPRGFDNLFQRPHVTLKRRHK